jgi:hypothetical protein
MGGYNNEKLWKYEMAGCPTGLWWGRYSPHYGYVKEVV